MNIEPVYGAGRLSFPGGRLHHQVGISSNLAVAVKQEMAMVALIQIVLGIAVCSTGFLWMQTNPLAGSSVLLAGGLTALSGVDNLYKTNH